MATITSKTEELIGEFSHEKVSRGADDSPDRWIVGVMKCGHTVTGNAKLGSLRLGERYRFLGSWRIHDTFGRQFHFSSFCHVEPIDLDAISRYLQKADDIGRVSAFKIVGEFGDKSLEILREKPSFVADRCSLRGEVCERAAVFFRGRKALERIILEVEGLLANRGFPKNLPGKVIEQWGEEAVATIKENPYVLRIFQGVGFLFCDRLYEFLGLPMDALIRQSHCALHALESDPSGNTWLPAKVIRDALREKIAGAKVREKEAIAEAIERGMIRHRRDGGQDFYAVAATADSESSWVSDLYTAVHEGDDSFGLAGETKWLVA